jgi:hypothetical protein
MPSPTNSRKPQRPTSQRPQPRPVRAPAPQPPSHNPVLQAQQQAGNQAIQQLFRSGAIQPRLQISQPGDPAELEAERMADAVTRHSPTTTPCACSGSEHPCEECSRTSGLHRSAGGVTPRIPSHQSMRAIQGVIGGGGHALDHASRSFFEPRFGRDLSQVRVHTGPTAAESARAIQARAYTFGSDIVFNHGQYQPASEAGRHLLAHELTHVLQQSAAPSTLHREADPPPKTLKQEAEDLIDRYRLSMAMVEDFSGIAYELNFALLALRYDYIMEVFDQLPSKWDDNVGAELIGMASVDRLQLYALSPQGRKMLNILYEAIITGDVSDFERKQATKILEATKISQSSYVAQQQASLLTFAVRNQGFTRDCYAVFSAELQPNGNVKVWYNSVRIWQCDMFKEDVATFPDRDPMRPRELAPDTLVNVHLYDEGGAIVPVPAIALIDYSNQSKNKTLSLAETAFITGLTVGAGGLGGTAVEAQAEGAAWGARASTWAARYGETAEAWAAFAAKVAPWAARASFYLDRVAIVLPVLADIVEENRDWIKENVPFGDEIVTGVEKTNAIIAYYGYARLGIDGIRFAKGQIKAVLKAREAGGIPSSLDAAERARLQKIDSNSQELLHQLDETEKALQAEQVAQQQAAAAPAPGTSGSAAPAADATTSAPHTQSPVTPSPAATRTPVNSAEVVAPPPPHQTTPPHTQAEPHRATPPHDTPKAHESAEPPKADPETTAKPGDFTPKQISDANQRLEERIADPKNVRAGKPGSGYDLEVDLGDGQIYKRKKDGSWCLFRNPIQCGNLFGPKIYELSEQQLQRLRTDESIRAAVELKQRTSGGEFTEAEIADWRARFEEHPELALDLLDEAALKQQNVIEPLDTDVDASIKTGRGGSGPGDAGRLGKDLSRKRAENLGDVWVCEEPKFRYANRDGSTSTFSSDVGMTSASQGGPYVIESKLGPNAALTDNQIPGYNALSKGEAYPANPAAERLAKQASPQWKQGDPMPVIPVRLEKWSWSKRYKDWFVTASFWK